MTQSFTIATSGRVGPRRWWHVRIYRTVHELRAAASAYHPAVDFSECTGCCHAVAWSGRAGYAGVLRFAEGHLTGEIIAHELLHAAVAVYRMNISEDVRLGRGVGEREEQLAYIYGELYAALEGHFQHTLRAPYP